VWDIGQGGDAGGGRRGATPRAFALIDAEMVVQDEHGVTDLLRSAV
jgi:hypothetical protein